MAEAARHVAKFWRPDPQIDAARKHPRWASFHRECGQQGLFFDDIEKQGRGYAAIAFRVEKSGEQWISYRVSSGTGRGPIEAVLSAFDAALAGGFAVDPTLGGLLTANTPAAPQINDLDALLGGASPPPAADDELMDLIG